MNVIQTEIPDLVIIEPRIFEDDRGYFYESYSEQRYKEAGIASDFVQDNEAFSSYGVVRGLHYQMGEYAQAKLVRVTQGLVYDVAVDMRQGSPTFGKWVGVELSGENKRQFYVPRGFAHGYAVLSETAVFAYKCDNLYNKASEGGVHVNCPELNIDWKVPVDQRIISEKDLILPHFSQAENNFTFNG